MNLYPTKTCFDDTKIVMYHLCDQDLYEPKMIKIIHAKVIFGKDLSCHAWIEYDGYCWDLACVEKVRTGKKIMLKTKAVTYYRQFKVQKKYTYTLLEALAHTQKHGDTTGPWEQELKELCHDYIDI